MSEIRGGNAIRRSDFIFLSLSRKFNDGNLFIEVIRKGRTIMNKIKVAVIGVGTISNHHIESYLNNENVELYAFCDINEKRLKLMGEKYGITRLYTDEAHMLAELSELDAVSVCTWNSAHAPCTIMALNAGKHVLCEKPMATCVEDAIAMKEAAEKNGKLLMIGFVRRFGRDCAIVSDLIKNNKLGEIYYAKVANIRRNGNPGGWFGEKARSGGGPLIDLGVHSIDLVRYLMGMPNPVSVYGTTFKKLSARNDVKTPKAYVAASATEHDICDCEDLASALIRFDNGVVISVEMSFSLNTGDEVNNIQMFGTEAGVKIDNNVTLYGTTDGYLTDTSFKGNNNLNMKEIFGGEIDHFVDCINGKTCCINTADDGIAMMKILTAIYKSAECGHEVEISM